MPRLFTGIEIPASLAGQLALLRGGLPGARFIEPSDYHITLRFIGDIDNPTANEIADMLAKIRRKPFRLKLTEFDSFGKDAPRSVFANIATSPELSELQAEHERIMQRLGLAPEGRKFKPHVTIARLKNATYQNVGDWIVMRSPPPFTPFDVTRFVLFSSRDSVGGGPYIVEQSYPLAT